MLKEIKIFLVLVLGIIVLQSKAASAVKNSEINRCPIFKEIATIGIEEAQGDEQKPYQFADVTSIEMDDQGNVYVLDQKESCVKKFSQSGKFIKTIITQGKGPGEISNPVNFTFNRFTKTLFVLHEYGFMLREFDLEGKTIKDHILPEQFFFFFDFLDSKRFLYPGKDVVNENYYYCFKIADLQSRKIEKKWYRTSVDIALNRYILFVMKDGLFWSSSDNQMELIAYDLTKDKLVKTIKTPGEKKKNFTKVIEEGKDYRNLWIIMYNYIQPFVFDNNLYVLLTRQEYKNEHERARTFPGKIEQELYILDEDKLVKVEEFRGFGMTMDRVRGNRILLKTDDPYPYLKIVELQKR